MPALGARVRLSKYVMRQGFTVDSGESGRTVYLTLTKSSDGRGVRHLYGIDLDDPPLGSEPHHGILWFDDCDEFMVSITKPCGRCGGYGCFDTECYDGEMSCDDCGGSGRVLYE